MAARKAKMRDLAESTGIPYPSLRNYLSGKHALPVQAAIRICDALRVSLIFVLTGDLPKPSRYVTARALELLWEVQRSTERTYSADECAAMLVGFYSKLAKEQRPAPEPPGSDRSVFEVELIKETEQPIE
jgi:AcrR family transcriptional regulator